MGRSTLIRSCCEVTFLLQKGVFTLTFALIAAYVATLLLAAADQGIKWWILENLQGQPPRPFLQIGDFDWMHLHFVENNGAAFSILSGSRWFLIVFSLLMTLACLVLMQKLYKNHRWLLIAMPLIAGGGIGNLIDRIFRNGLVVDFLDFQLCKFAVFNFADICVTIGVIFLAICIMFVEKDEPSAKKVKDAKREPHTATYTDAETVGECGTAAGTEDAGTLEDAKTVEDAEDLPDA